MSKSITLQEELESIFDSVYPQQINLKSFEKKTELNPKIWTRSGNLKKIIRKHLYEIAMDFIDDFEMQIVPDDIVLVGSITGYNWSKYSDIDLHIMVDFSKLRNHADHDTLKELFDMKKNDWNQKHNILIYGYPVEMYVQDINEDNASAGIYSIKYGMWNKIPEDVTPQMNRDIIKTQASQYINIIDKIEELAQNLTSKRQCRILKDEVKKIHDEIVMGRRESLPVDGEFAAGNIVFKVLRRTGHIGKLKEIKLMLSDKINSI